MIATRPDRGRQRLAPSQQDGGVPRRDAPPEGTAPREYAAMSAGWSRMPKTQKAGSRARSDR